MIVNVSPTFLCMHRKMENELLSLYPCDSSLSDLNSIIYAKIFSCLFFFFFSQPVTAVQPASLILFIAASFKEFPGDFWIRQILIELLKQLQNPY